jgi:hypothetical protein
MYMTGSSYRTQFGILKTKAPISSLEEQEEEQDTHVLPAIPATSFASIGGCLTSLYISSHISPGESR